MKTLTVGQFRRMATEAGVPFTPENYLRVSRSMRRLTGEQSAGFAQMNQAMEELAAAFCIVTLQIREAEQAQTQLARRRIPKSMKWVKHLHAERSRLMACMRAPSIKSPLSNRAWRHGSMNRISR